MNCGDLDRLRMEPRAKWPTGASEHLLTCARCAPLQALIEGAPSVEVPGPLRASIEAALLSDLRPVSPIPNVFRVIIGLLCSLIVVVAAANWRLGIDGWHARSALQASVNFGLLGLFILLLAGGLAHQMMPGSSRGFPSLLYIAAPVVVLLTADVLLFNYRWSPRFLPVGLHCWEIGVTCAALSAPLFWLVLRRGFSLQPAVTGAMVGLLSGLTGVTVLEIYCPYLDRLHISAWHLGAAVTSTLVGAALGFMQSRIQRSTA